MRKKALAFILGIVIFSCPQAQAKLFPHEEFILENGLRVILYEKKGAPVILQMIFYDAGSIDEKEGKSGVAHFLEHLIFKGKNADFSAKINKLGGEHNAFTAYDHTAYYEITTAEKAADIISMESVRMGNFSFSKEDFETEKKVVQQERLMRKDRSRKAPFLERLRSSLWHSHPYGIPVIGWPQEFAYVTESDIYDFYERFYVPNNAVLVFAGDFDTETVKSLVREKYGIYKRKPVERKSYKFEGTSDISLFVVDEQVDQGMIYMMFVADSIGKQMFKENPSYDDVYALIVASRILGGGNTSRLYKRLVRSKELAIDIGSGYSGFSREEESFFIAVMPKDGASEEKIVAIIKEEMGKMAKKGVTEKELATAKETFFSELVFMKEDIAAVAEVLAQAALLGYDPNEMERGVKNVSNKDIKRVMQGLLDSPGKITGIQKGGKE